MVLTSKWGRIQPGIQIWHVQVTWRCMAVRKLPKDVLKMASGLISPSGLAGHRGQLCTGALHSSFPPRNYPYQSTWSVSAVLRDTSPSVLINSGASVNNRWSEARYVDVDMPYIYYRTKNNRRHCVLKRIFNNNIYLMALGILEYPHWQQMLQ